jgi:azurin
MKIRSLLVPVFAALVVSGCGQKDTATAPVAAAPAAAPAAAAPAPVAGPRVIEITANDQMKYSVTTIEAKAGEKLKVVLTNIGQLPKEAMGHNWVLLKAGSDAMAYATAASTARESEYFPAALESQVIAHIPLLGPRKSGEAVFTVPAAGEYPFLCTFPAHYAVGMKGTLIVK